MPGSGEGRRSAVIPTRRFKMKPRRTTSRVQWIMAGRWRVYTINHKANMPVAEQAPLNAMEIQSGRRPRATRGVASGKRKPGKPRKPAVLLVDDELVAVVPIAWASSAKAQPSGPGAKLQMNPGCNCSGVVQTYGLTVHGASGSVVLGMGNHRAGGPANRQTGGLTHAST